MSRRIFLVIGGVALFGIAAVLNLSKQDSTPPLTAALTAPAEVTPAPAVAAMASSTEPTTTPPSAPMPQQVSPELRRQALTALMDAADKQESRLQAQLRDAKQRGASAADITAIEDKLARVAEGRNYAMVKNAQLGE